MIGLVSFLALPAWQAWTLAALTAGLVLTLFFLKMRHPRVVVGSLLLWQRVLQERRQDSLIEKLRRLLSLVLALAIALSIALSLAEPAPKRSALTDGRLTIVLDTSYSMTARTADGRTRWAHALDLAAALIDGAGPSAELAVLDTAGRVSIPITRSREAARTALARMAPGADRQAFPALPTPPGDISFITDGVGLRDVPDNVRRISVFEAAPNVAITAFDVRPIPSRAQRFEAYLEVANFGAEPRSVVVTVDASGRRAAERRPTLAGGESYREAFELPSRATGGLHAQIAPADDAIPDDNDAYAFVPERARARVTLVTVGNPLLVAALSSDPKLAVRLHDPASLADLEAGADVLVFDRVAPPAPLSMPSLIIAPADVPSWIGRPRALVRNASVTDWDATHPVLSYVPLSDVHLTRVRPIDVAEGHILAASGEAPLIVARERPTRTLIVALDLFETDFGAQLGFPIFIENAIDWLTERSAIVRAKVGPVELPWPDANVATPEKTPVPARQLLGRSVFDAPHPGIFFATSGSTRRAVVVNLTDGILSSINATMFDTRQATTRIARTLIPMSDWWKYLVAVALTLGALEWWTYHRRITV